MPMIAQLSEVIGPRVHITSRVTIPYAMSKAAVASRGPGCERA